MYERLSRFNTQPGDIKIPSPLFYPSKPVQLQARWLVQLRTDGGNWGGAWRCDEHVWATSSIEAVARARMQFYDRACVAIDERPRWPLRVVGVLQEAV